MKVQKEGHMSFLVELTCFRLILECRWINGVRKFLFHVAINMMIVNMRALAYLGPVLFFFSLLNVS